MRRALLLPLLLVPMCALAAAPAPEPHAVQVQRGEVLYFQACAICHGDRQEGLTGPALSGADFRATFGHGQGAALHALIAATMPDERPGSLSAQEALDVTAYLLDVNGLPRLDKDRTSGPQDIPPVSVP